MKSNRCRLPLYVLAFITNAVSGTFLRLPSHLDNLHQKTLEKPSSRPVSAASNSVCNASTDGYNETQCFKQALGRTREQLTAELNAAESLNYMAIRDSSNHSILHAQQCTKKFYLWSFHEWDTLFPVMTKCLVTIYASVVQAAAMKNPCRASKPSQADVLMVPPYSALECNWPVYGGGDCNAPGNRFKGGYHHCTGDVVTAASKLQSMYPGKKILLIDQNPYWEPYSLPKESYAVEGHIWAKVNSLPPWYRPNVDVSMPPAATDRCRRTPAKAYEEPLYAKRFFVSFKGKVNDAERYVVKTLINNDKDQIIADSNDPRYDFDDLLQSSRFNLILKGDVEFSYRFNEAVCSGGVPVLVTDLWVPPFNEFLPFDSYGVLFRISEIPYLIKKLRAMPDEEVQRRRNNARTYCKSAFQKTEQSVSALLAHITG